MTLYRDLRKAGEEDERTLVRADRRDDRLTLTLADPERLNPLSAGLTLQLQERLDEIARDPDIRSVVITGEDPRLLIGR